MTASGGFEQACEAELVAVGIVDVKVPLTPFGVSGFGLWFKTKGDGSRSQPIRSLADVKERAWH
jgi:hypothetical protein